MVPVADLNFYSGTMDCGKSTLALQMDHNHRARGRVGRVFTSHDRAGTATLSSRLGLAVPAIEVDDTFHFWQYTVDELTHGGRIDYFVCDEAQFYTADQIDQLAKITDELSIDVFAFGILTDFRTSLFPGSARLIELADHVHTLQVEALCWCGERATHNARTEDGIMVTEGEVIVVGDVDVDEDLAAGEIVLGEDPDESVVGYEVLCRRHHRRRMTAAAAKASALSPDVLPFD
jgi:thymidine kinase